MNFIKKIFDKFKNKPTIRKKIVPANSYVFDNKMDYENSNPQDKIIVEELLENNELYKKNGVSKINPQSLDDELGISLGMSMRKRRPSQIFVK